MTVVVFDYQTFIADYPEFAETSETVLTNWFNQACCVVNNTDNSIVRDIPSRTNLLYLLTAHYAFLINRGSGVVGKLSSASEGSVSSGFSFNGEQRAEFYNQSVYGQMYWQISLPYRLGLYVC